MLDCTISFLYSVRCSMIRNISKYVCTYIISLFSDLFHLNPVTGLITTQRTLGSESGSYNLSVLVRNQDGDVSMTDKAYVEITVLEMSNRPPQWRLPNPNNQTVEIYEVCTGEL